MTEVLLGLGHCSKILFCRTRSDMNVYQITCMYVKAGPGAAMFGGASQSFCHTKRLFLEA